MVERQAEEINRAEKIRARRQESRKKTQVNPFGNSASRKQTQHSAPVTRRASTTTPIINRKQRKVSVPLKSKGVEVQLPALPRLRLGWRLISGAVFLLSLFVVISFSSFGTFKVSAVTLEGAQLMSEETILSYVDLMGKSIIALKPEEIRAGIEENLPGLIRAEVSVSLPASVSIQVVERHPLILWQSEGRSYWIDAEGVLFPPQGDTDVPLTVIANGDPPAAQVAEEQETSDEAEEMEDTQTDSNPAAIVRTTPGFVQGILALMEMVPQDSSLQYDPQFGLGWQDPRGWQVYFGKDTADMELKLAEYETIVATLTAQNLTPSLISLEFLDAPFYRLE